MNEGSFKPSELKLIAKADPSDIPYIVKGATVWLRSGSPPMVVDRVDDGNAIIKLNTRGYEEEFSFPVECLTPEPSPLLKGRK